MKPSFLLIDTYYPAFLDYFYKRNKEVINKNYKKQKADFTFEFLQIAGFYSSSLVKLGCQTEDIIINKETLQKK